MPQLLQNTEFIITSLVFVAALGSVGLMAVLERRPKKALEPRLLPTTPLMLVFGFVALVALVHLVNLGGVHTGR